MKALFLITGLGALATVVFGLPATHGTNLASNDDDSNIPTTQEARSIIAEIVKREEGLSAVIPDVPSALIHTLGNNDCYLDCKEDFPKAFVCWYYNNTRCDGCSLTSDDQSCRNLCVCRRIGQTWSDKTVAGASPISTPDLDYKETAITTTSDPENYLQANQFYCGSADLTQLCKVQDTACSTEGIVSENSVCRKYCFCRNWNSSTSLESKLDTTEPISDSTIQIYPFVCGGKNLTQECAANGTSCTTEGLTSDSDVCRERCNCQYKSTTSTGISSVVFTKDEASNTIRDLSVHCIGLDLTAACITNGTTCTADGIQTASKKCFEYCWCQGDTPSNVEARQAAPTQQELAAGPWSCGSKTLDEECALQNTFCTSHGVSSSSDICRDRCFCHRLTIHTKVDKRLNTAPGSMWCGSVQKTQYCRNEKTFCTANGLWGDDAKCLENCDCIMDTQV